MLTLSIAAQAEQYTIPWFVPAGVGGAPQGVLRILNGTDETGSVEIYAIGDAGVRSGPASFTLNASAAAEFTATDLQSGNAMLGLTGGIGAEAGDARLEIVTDLQIVPLAYVRAADGTLSAMHDTVRAAAVGGSGGVHRYEVPLFNPASDAVQQSRLRLINPGNAVASVMIEGRDDHGAIAAGGTVELTLAAGAARTLTALQLEAGDTDLTGRLGAGVGRWRLTVSSDQPIQVVNVVSSTSGNMNNLSTTAVAGPAPVDHDAFNARFLGSEIEFRTDSGDFTFAPGAGDTFTVTREIDGATTSRTGRYGYAALGADAGRMTQSYDDALQCEANLYFATPASGWFASFCTGADNPDGYWVGGNWSVADDVDGGDGGDPISTTYGVGETLPGVPTSGAFVPSVLSGGTVSANGGETTIDLDEGGYFELSDGTRYACASADGCTIANGAVTRGTVTGTAPGTGEVDRFPTFRTAANPGNQTYTAGTAIDPLTLPEASGGNGTLRYSLSPTVPGLSFNASARQLTGTPSTPGTYTMTYTVTDEDGDADNLGFTITVSGGTAGTGSLGVCEVGMSLSSGQSCRYPGTSDEFSVNARGRGSFLGRLAGIRIRINNETIDGREYDFEASHQGGGAWRIDQIAGRREPPSVPRFAEGAGPGDLTFTVGAAIATLTLPEASEGNGTLRYALSPDVPGLTFHAATRELSGTPTAAGSYDLTYTVVDEDGDADSLDFSIAVQERPVAAPAPADAAAFHDRFVGNRIEDDDPGNHIDFVSADRFRETVGTKTHDGRFDFTSTGADTGKLALLYDDGTECTSNITFAIRTSGRRDYTCTDGTAGESAWRLIDRGGPPLRRHHVILRVVLVTPDWVPYASTDGWTRAVPVKESGHVKYFEAAIWEETSSVHLYEFANDYDARYSRTGNPTDEESIAYREQFARFRHDGMPPPWTSQRSEFLRRAFEQFATYLTERYPDSEHHLMYHGHGGPGGRLFGSQLEYQDANGLLGVWRQALSRPLGVIDMGGPCNKGSFSDLENFCEHARYYVASDLPNGGYTFDHWTVEKHNETEPEHRYPSLLAESESLESALIGRIDLRQQRYEYSRNNMIAERVEQANYLYSCTDFASFRTAFRSFLADSGADYSIWDDLYRFMQDHNAEDELLQQFNSVIIHSAHNRDFFEWEVVANGMLMPWAD